MCRKVGTLVVSYVMQQNSSNANTSFDFFTTCSAVFTVDTGLDCAELFPSPVLFVATGWRCLAEGVSTVDELAPVLEARRTAAAVDIGGGDGFLSFLNKKLV